MKTSNIAPGLLAFFLTLLVACTNAPPSPEPQVIETGCPAVVPCVLRPAAPRSNGALGDSRDQAEADWAECAGQVDAVYDYQQKHGAPQP